MSIWNGLVAEDLECEAIFVAMRRTNRVPFAATWREHCQRFDHELNKALYQGTLDFVHEMAKVSREEEL